MAGRRVLIGLWVAGLVVGACATTPPPSLTPPPLPADALPWVDLVWSPVELPPLPFDVEAERIVAVTAGPDGFAAVGYRETAGVRDGAIWSSADGSEWSLVGAPAILAGVELLDVATGPGGFAALGVTNTGPQGLRPQAVFYRSDDGQAWQRLPSFPGSLDAYPSSLDGGDDGLLAAGYSTDGGGAAWISADGRSWERVVTEGAGADGVVDPRAAADGFLGLGANEDAPPVSLRSKDGVSWTASLIDPGPDAVAYRLVIGRWGYLAQGLLTPGCDPLASCVGQPIAWWSGDAGTWGRLPADGSPTSNGGSIIVPAEDHGFLAIDGASAWGSADGWRWTGLPEPGDGSIGINDAVVADDTIVAVGQEDLEDGTSVGRILLGQAGQSGQ